MATTYPPAQTPWSIGDLVIHDDDAKRADVLMVVTGCGSDGIHRTRYAFPTEQPRSGQREVWRHKLAPLHDPSRFGIDVPRGLFTPAASVSAPRLSAATLLRSGPSATS